MTTTTDTACTRSDPGAGRADLAEPTALSDDELVVAIGAGAARIAALQCRFLLLAAEVDRRRLWARWGMTSAAAWLSWRCALDRVTAREHLRVGHALAVLPRIKEAFGAGRLSYSKVRAIVRVAGPDDEEHWLGVALSGTASQVHALVRGYRTAVSEGTAENRPGLRWLWDDDGYLLVTARLAPAEGAVVLAALRQAEDALREAVAPGCDDALPVDSAEAPSPVDALALVAQTSLTVGPRPSSSTEAYEVVVHVAADGVHLDHGPALPPSAVKQIECDTRVTALLRGADRLVTGVGRRSRRVPDVLRRALLARDRGTCRHPGCSNTRWLQAHHVVEWSAGGRTDPDNLVLLCFFHHRVLHEGRFSVTAMGGQRFEFLDAGGQLMVQAPALADLPGPAMPSRLLSEVDLELEPTRIAGHWDGERLDLHYAVSVFAANRRLRDARAACQPARAA